MNANFWTESKVRLAQQKLLLKIACLLTLFLFSSARKTVDVTAVFTNGPRAQYLRPNRSRFVFYLAHAAVSLVAEYQLRQLPLQMFVENVLFLSWHRVRGISCQESWNCVNRQHCSSASLNHFCSPHHTACLNTTFKLCYAPSVNL